MFCGAIEFDLLLPSDSRTLKIKRSYIRPIIAALRKYEVSVAEVDDHDIHGRASLAVAAVAADNTHLTDILDSCERAVAARVEVQLLSTHRRIFGPED